jgi:hypothetical protein
MAISRFVKIRIVGCLTPKIMLNRSQCRSFVGLAAMGILSAMLPVSAQESGSDNVQPLDNDRRDLWQNSNERDPLTGAEPGGFDVYDLLNRARFDRGRSMSEFVIEQEESLLEDAASFRARQIELIRSQSQSQPTSESEESAD